MQAYRYIKSLLVLQFRETGLGFKMRIMSILYSYPKKHDRIRIANDVRRKAKPRRSRRNRLRRVNRRGDADVLVVYRAGAPRENTDAIGDAARRRHVSAVTAFKYPAKQARADVISVRAPEEKPPRSPSFLVPGSSGRIPEVSGIEIACSCVRESAI